MSEKRDGAERVGRVLPAVIRDLLKDAKAKTNSEDGDLLAPYWRTRARLLTELQGHVRRALEDAADNARPASAPSARPLVTISGECAACGVAESQHGFQEHPFAHTAEAKAGPRNAE